MAILTHLRLLSRLDDEQHVVVQLVVLAEVDVVIVYDVLGQLLLISCHLACILQLAVDAGLVVISLCFHG